MVMRMNKLKSRQKMGKFHAKGDRMRWKIKECHSEIFLNNFIKLLLLLLEKASIKEDFSYHRLT